MQEWLPDIYIIFGNILNEEKVRVLAVFASESLAKKFIKKHTKEKIYNNMYYDCWAISKECE